MCKQRPETTRCRLCCEKLGTSHDVKGFAIVSVLECIVVERANDLCYKNIKNAGLWSVQNWSIFNKVFPENNHKIGLFLTDWFSAKFVPKIPAKSVNFSVNLPLKIQWNLTFFSDLSEALHSMVQSMGFENIVDRSRYKFGGKLALFMQFGTFFMMKAK